MIQTMKNRSLVSIDDFTTGEILRILDLAEEFEKDPVSKLFWTAKL
jgi:ornithine carbamoyltransferase